MAIPAYLWLKDDGGADIKGSVDVMGRENSIEVVSFTHGLGTASNGCIVLVRRHRDTIANSGDTELVVI